MPTAIMETSKGTINLELFDKDAPNTVKNFTDLAKKGFYDGLNFHRVIKDFMVQGGDPEGTGRGGPGYRFQDETKGSPHSFDKPGKLAMANAGPGTNGSQFFITTVPTQWLTGKHTIFGEVIEGQEIAVKITNVPKAPGDKPIKPVVLESVVIERVA